MLDEKSAEGTGNGNLDYQYVKRMSPERHTVLQISCEAHGKAILVAFKKGMYVSLIVVP